jgi:hypothetical protein
LKIYSIKISKKKTRSASVKTKSEMNLIDQKYVNKSSSIVKQDLRRFKSEYSINMKGIFNENESNSSTNTSNLKNNRNYDLASSESSTSTSEISSSNDWYSAESQIIVENKNKPENQGIDSRTTFLLIKTYLANLDKINKLCNQENFKESNYSAPELNWSVNFS